MNKFYLIAAAACVALSASAVDKTMLASKNMKAGDVSLYKTNARMADSNKVRGVFDAKSMRSATRADEAAATPFAYYWQDPAIWSIGLSENGYGYNSTFGFASSYGNLNFVGLGQEGSGYSWYYTDVNDYTVVDKKAEWNVSEAQGQLLQIKSRVGVMEVPELTVKSGSASKSYAKENMALYYLGGGGYYWEGEDELGGEYGVSAYQSMGLADPNNSYGYWTPFLAFQPGEDGFSEGGAYIDGGENPYSWSYFLGQYGNVSDIAVDNFMTFWAKPASGYYMSRMWGQIFVSASSETQLISYIYPVDEEGVLSDTPIAIGYAPVPSGNSGWFVFEYAALNEDGDEVEEDIFIDSEVAITIEGFAGNDAIKYVMPLSGFAPFSFNAYEQTEGDVITAPTLYAGLSFNLDGTPASTIRSNPMIYGFDEKDDDSCTMLGYHQMSIDAMFPFIHAVNGEDKVSFPVEGGSADVEIEALYFVCDQTVGPIYDVTAPEWLTVSFSDPDQETQTTVMTVKAAACADAGREGAVTIEGLNVSYELKVVQGEGNAVSVVAVDKNAEYFDLSGRRVINPEKGIYIKKTAGKAEKVIL